MIGTQVSHYKILEKIGEGGMGEVFLAEDTKLKRQVALKFLPDDLTRDEERKQRFMQEARTAAAIVHPHIAAIHEVDEINGRTFMANPGSSWVEYFKRSLHIKFDFVPLTTDLTSFLADETLVRQCFVTQEPQVAAKNTNFIAYPNGNLASRQYIDKAILEDPTIYPPPQTMARLFTISANDARTQRAMNRLWTRVKTGR